MIPRGNKMETTKNITITNPTPQMLRFFEDMRNRKERQLKKLAEQKECTFTIKI